MSLANIQWLAEFRSFKKYLGSNLLIIVLLSVGLGSTLIIFGFLKALVLDPIPFPNATSLREVGLVTQEDPDDLQNSSGQLVKDWFALFPDGNHFFAVARGTINVSGQNNLQPERQDGGFVLGTMWTQLGVKPRLGRDFAPTDFLPNAPKVAIIGDQLWRKRYAADPNVLGKSIRLNGETATVIAVMAERMSFPLREQVWTQANLAEDGAQLDYGFSAFFTVTAQFEQHMASLQQALLARKKLDSNFNDYTQVAPRPLSDWAVNDQTKVLASIMFIAVMLLLFAVCLNAASVLLVRLLAEQGQNSVRLALGSGWAPLASSALIQSFALAACGAFFAHFVARFGGGFVLGMFEGSEEGLPMWMDVAASVGRWHLLTFAALSAVLTALLPIWRLRQLALTGMLRANSRAVTATQKGARVLVFLQVAFSCAVVMCAAVVVQQVRTLRSHPVGVEGAQLLTGRVGLFEQSYPDDAALRAFRDNLAQRLQTHPQVQSATISTALPASTSDGAEVTFGAMAPADGEQVYLGHADEQFLSTYGIPLVAGRALTRADLELASVAKESSCAAVIDLRLAEKMGGNAAALGTSIRLNPESPESYSCSVVGVMGNVELNQVDGDLHPAMLIPITKVSPHFVSVAVRVKGDPAAFKQELSRIVATVDPDLPMYWLRTFDEVFAATTVGNQVLSFLFSGLAIIALGLSAAGLYGMLAFQAQSRTREIGLRLALGAGSLGILRALFLPSLMVVGIGVLTGTLLAIYPSQLLGGIVDASDVSYTTAISGITVLVLFVFTALVAAIKPALLTLSVTPQTALRND